MAKTEKQIVEEAHAVKDRTIDAENTIADEGACTAEQSAALKAAFQEIGKAVVQVI